MGAYVYHELVEFEQNRMIRTKNPLTMLTILNKSLAPFWKIFL